MAAQDLQFSLILAVKNQLAEGLREARAELDKFRRDAAAPMDIDLNQGINLRGMTAEQRQTGFGAFMQEVADARDPEAAAAREAKAARESERRQAEMMRNTEKVGLAMAATGAAIQGAMWVAANSTAKYAEELDRLHDKTGLAVGFLSEVRYAAEHTGVSMGQVETGLEGLARNAYKAAHGLSETATRGFDTLGVSVTDAYGNIKETDVLLSEVAGALRDVRSDTTRAALAMDIFGESGSDLLPMFVDTGAGFDELRQKARDLGLAIDEEGVAKGKAYAETMKDLKAVAADGWRTMGEAAIPTLQWISAWLTNVVEGTSAWAKRHEDAAGVIATSMLVAGGALQAFGTYFWMVPHWVDALKILKNSFVGTAIATKLAGLSAAWAAGGFGALGAAMWAAIVPVLPYLALALIVIAAIAKTIDLIKGRTEGETISGWVRWIKGGGGLDIPEGATTSAGGPDPTTEYWHQQRQAQAASDYEKAAEELRKQEEKDAKVAAAAEKTAAREAEKTQREAEREQERARLNILKWQQEQLRREEWDVDFQGKAQKGTATQYDYDRERLRRQEWDTRYGEDMVTVPIVLQLDGQTIAKNQFVVRGMRQQVDTKLREWRYARA